MNNQTGIYRRIGKRLFDLFLVIPLMVILLPLYFLIALLIRLRLGKPVIFRHIRPGIYERFFVAYKYRTMTDERGSDGKLLPDKDRLTSTGRIIRKLSLDELPQLYNVLRGDMSLVGPRPLFSEYLPYYTQRERKRHSVRPGITGLAQVSGRNKLKWEDRLEMDVQYVENISFGLDLKILYKTFWKVLRRTDVLEIPGTAVMPLSEYRKKKKNMAYDS